MPEKITLERFLVLSGQGNRRHSAWLIRQGRVTVNGKPARDSKFRVSREATICLDGTPLTASALQTWALNKPRGYICQTGEADPPALGLLPPDRGLGLIGRLDRESEGLILATNDGDLAHRLAHPEYHVEKVYEVCVEGSVTTERLSTLCSGLVLDGTPTRPLKGRLLDRPGPGTWLELILTEGRKRQIRRLCEQVGLEVTRLVRVRLGSLTLEGLDAGSCRLLDQNEVAALREISASGER